MPCLDRAALIGMAAPPAAMAGRAGPDIPHHPADAASEDEAGQAIEVARQLIRAAEALIEQLPLFA
jgi:hypothetical protein